MQELVAHMEGFAEADRKKAAGAAGTAAAAAEEEVAAEAAGTAASAEAVEETQPWWMVAVEEWPHTEDPHASAPASEVDAKRPRRQCLHCDFPVTSKIAEDLPYFIPETNDLWKSLLVVLHVDRRQPAWKIPRRPPAF